jgi:hypothetical protein
VVIHELYDGAFRSQLAGKNVTRVDAEFARVQGLEVEDWKVASSSGSPVPS